MNISLGRSATLHCPRIHIRMAKMFTSLSIFLGTRLLHSISKTVGRSVVVMESLMTF